MDRSSAELESKNGTCQPAQSAGNCIPRGAGGGCGKCSRGEENNRLQEVHTRLKNEHANAIIQIEGSH